MRTVKALSYINFRNYVGGYIGLEDIHSYLFDAIIPEADYESGFGPLADKGELANTEIIHSSVGKRVFRGWIKEMPVGLGFQITRYNFKIYFIRWILGVGFIPQEVLWEREQKQSNLVSSSGEGQSAIT